MEPKILIPTLAFLSTITVLGAFLYLYLRQKQNKFIPKDKYDEARNESYEGNNRLSHNIAPPSIIGSRLLTFYSTYVGLVALFLLFVGVSYGGSIWQVTGLVLLSIVVSPFILLIFPSGVEMFFVPNSQGGFIGYILYIVICLLGVYAKDRRVFIFIYLVFIMLLIMNVIGCSRTDLSGLS